MQYKIYEIKTKERGENMLKKNKERRENRNNNSCINYYNNNIDNLSSSINKYSI